jgi:hypothetical protein
LEIPIWSPKICLIFLILVVCFEFLRGLHHVGLFWEKVAPVR